MLPSFHSLLPLLTFLLLLCHEAVPDKLLVLYMDALQWRYVDRHLSKPFRSPTSYVGSEPTNGFFLMKHHGVHARRVRPVFPSQCLPNIHSSFTGRHPRYHGIMGSQLYDPETGYHFNYHATAMSSHFDQNPVEAMVNHFEQAPKHWWQSKAEMLWDTVANQTGRNTHLYYLPSVYELMEVQRRRSLRRGMEMKGDQHVVLPYKRDITWMTFRERVLEAVGHMRRDVTDFAVVYSDQLDRDGHMYGPDSVHVEETMMKLDSLLQAVLHEVYIQPEARIHVMLMSDHGMQAIEERKRVEVEWYILRSELKKIVNDGTIVGVWPKKGMEHEVYSRLKAGEESSPEEFTVAWTRDINMGYYFGTEAADERLPSIVMMAKKGYVLISREFPFPRRMDSLPGAGLHGYHPNHEDMHSTMLAFGPKLDIGKHVENLNIIDVYQLMCHILGVSPKPHNGTFENIAPLLKKRRAEYQVIQSKALRGHAYQTEVKPFALLLSFVVSLSWLRFF